ncbi:hypothetical protein SNE40_013583 [Patella caerulea]|uniref:C-type lectin domain-containing protein n=1 Tax=Patella caerulea TaxID=87958 RepID=A0AAN8JCL5_PATCE
MEYSVSVTGVVVTECGRLCMSIRGCNLFHYESSTCYILNSPATGSINITTMFGLENWRESCNVTDYPLFGGQFCIKTFDDQQNWATAKNTCSQNGGQLLTMKSDDFFLKQEVLKRIIPEISDRRYWLGGNDKATEGDWRWNDGSSILLDPHYWTPDNPSNSGGKEDCIELRYLHFNDQDCAYQKKFICEKLKV